MELSESWVDGRSELRWPSTVATGPATAAAASGSSILEVDPGCALPRHTDSAEETIVSDAEADLARVCSAGNRPALNPASKCGEVVASVARQSDSVSGREFAS